MKKRGRPQEQFPGKPWTFVSRKTGEQDSGILPDGYGLSNQFARWCGTRRSWLSKKFQRISRHAEYRRRARGVVQDGHFHLEPGESAKRRLFRQYKRGAKQRHLVWTLLYDEFGQLTKGDCFYCGVEPLQILQPKSQTCVQTPYFYNGVDRLDNLKGYESENVVSCCEVCNRAKHAMALSEFLSWCRQIAVHFGETMNKASKAKVSEAFHEVHANVPKNVKATGKTGEAKEAMMTAIALSKARAAGADIPKKHDGGEIMKDGVYELQKDEKVIPAGDRGAGYDETPHRSNPSGQQGLQGKCSTYSTYNDNVVPEGASAMGTTEHSVKYADTQTGAHDKFLGRTPPKAEPVKDAVCQEGVGAECARKQINGDVRNEYTVSSFGGKPYKA